MNEKILIIEDREDIAAILKDSLTAHGYDVVVAHSAMEGISRARDISPALITIDIKMPGMDGIDGVRRLKESLETSSIPVVVVSALDMNYRKRCLEAGAVAYFQKPVDFSRLRNFIENTVKKDNSEDSS